MENAFDGKLCLPLFFNSIKDEHSSEILKSLIYIASEREYDVLYTHCSGDLTKEVLLSVKSIETPKKSYFSLYNNSMNLTPSQLYIPLF